MESILRAAVIYLIVWLVMRVTGKRTLAQVTVFDFVLLIMVRCWRSRPSHSRR